MKRTTILADEQLLQEARYLAKAEGKTLTAVVREALAEYVAAHRPKRRVIPFAGIGNSGDPTLVYRIDEILKAEIDPIEGWSPRLGRAAAERERAERERAERAKTSRA